MQNSADNYAQWIRNVMTQANDEQLILIGSSFDEPLHLLGKTLKKAFQGGLPETYQSVFVNGNPLVVDLLSSHYRVAPESVLCTTGVTTSLALLYRTFTQPGDHILIESPGLDLFTILANERGLDIDFVDRPARLNFSVDLDNLKAKIRKDTRLLVLSNLHNPSGALMLAEEIKEIAAIAAAHDCIVIMDEIYLGYVENEDGSATSAHLAENIVAINSLTKTHGLSSLRCGWVIASARYMEPLRRYNSLHEYGVSKLAHAIAGLVLQEEDIYRAHRQSVMKQVKPRIDFHIAELIKDGLVNDFVPQYGCMYFPIIKGIDDTKAFTSWLGREKKVVVAPGEYFGMSGAVRLGLPERNNDLCLALERFSSGIRTYIEEGR